MAVLKRDYNRWVTKPENSSAVMKHTATDRKRNLFENGINVAQDGQQR